MYAVYVLDCIITSQKTNLIQFYHDLFPQLTLKLNPSAPYNQQRRETRDIRFKPTQEDLVYEMEKFLDNPWVRPNH